MILTLTRRTISNDSFIYPTSLAKAKADYEKHVGDKMKTAI
jgi:hypothetical protein